MLTGGADMNDMTINQSVISHALALLGDEQALDIHNTKDADLEKNLCILKEFLSNKDEETYERWLVKIEEEYAERYKNLDVLITQSSEDISKNGYVPPVPAADPGDVVRLKLFYQELQTTAPQFAL